MQYIEGLQVMAKKLGDQWEFGISGYAKEGGRWNPKSPAGLPMNDHFRLHFGDGTSVLHPRAFGHQQIRHHPHLHGFIFRFQHS